MKPANTLAAFACAVLLSAGVLCSAGFAQAQDGNADANGIIAEPDAKTYLPVNGCWTGSFGLDIGPPNTSGFGFLVFVQNGSKLGTGTMAGIFLLGPGIPPSITPPLKGKASSMTFQVSYKKKACQVSFHGMIASGGDLVGTFHLTKACVGQVLGGTFDFTFDQNGIACQG